LPGQIVRVADSVRAPLRYASNFAVTSLGRDTLGGLAGVPEVPCRSRHSSANLPFSCRADGLESDRVRKSNVGDAGG